MSESCSFISLAVSGSQSRQYSTFVVESDAEVPPEMVSLVRLLSLPLDEWIKVKNKNKMPNPKLDATVLEVVEKVFRLRLQAYTTSLVVGCFFSYIYPPDPPVLDFAPDRKMNSYWRVEGYQSTKGTRSLYESGRSEF